MSVDKLSEQLVAAVREVLAASTPPPVAAEDEGDMSVAEYVELGGLVPPSLLSRVCGCSQSYLRSLRGGRRPIPPDVASKLRRLHAYAESLAAERPERNGPGRPRKPLA